MKRFIDIGNQTEEAQEGSKEFAFYDTVRGEFESHGGSMKWDSAEDFKLDYQGDEIERYLRLIPENFNKPQNTAPIKEFDNEQRTRYYGLRKGDTVSITAFGNVKKNAEVFDYGFMDNNRVILKFEDGTKVPYVAEWCTIITKVEDKS